MSKTSRIAFSTAIFVYAVWTFGPLLIESSKTLVNPENKVGNWIMFVNLVLILAMTFTNFVSSIFEKLNGLVVNLWLLLGASQIAITLNSYVNNEIVRTEAISDIILTTVFFLLLASLLASKPTQGNKQ